MKKNSNNDPRKSASMDNYSGWSEEEGEGSSGNARSMSKEPSDPQSPDQLYKQRRLSRLLDKLTVQLLNNNHYPQTQPLSFPQTQQALQIPPQSHSNWLPLIPPSGLSINTDEMPLDLSMKPRRPPTPTKAPEFTCNACGQTFSVHDRLVKHMASRHKNRTPESARNYECKTCNRRFARSDMLTRHVRLHTGVKPYACTICGQVFSRSDHLTTHHRTHTGEKPYHCPSCTYAACRRDMITRHMRTHNRRLLET